MRRIDEYDYCVLRLIREGAAGRGEAQDELREFVGIDAWGNDWHGLDLEEDGIVQVIIA